MTTPRQNILRVAKQHNFKVTRIIADDYQCVMLHKEDWKRPGYQWQEVFDSWKDAYAWWQNNEGLIAHGHRPWENGETYVGK